MSAIALNTSEAENEIILGKNLSAGRRSLAFLSIVIVYFFYCYNFMVGTFVKPTMIAEAASGGFGFTLQQSETIFAVMSFGTIPGTIVFGILNAKIGKKYTLIVVASLIALTTFLPMMTPGSYQVWLVSRLITGGTLGGVFGCAMPLVTELFPQKYRGKLAAVLTSLFSLAMIFGGQLYSFMGDSNWQVLMYTAIIPPAVGAVMIFLFVPNDYQNTRQLNEVSKQQNEKISYLNMYKGKYLWIGLGVILLSGANFTAYSAFSNNATTYLRNSLGLSAAVAGGIYSLQGIGQLIGYNIWGFISDRFGRKKPLIGMALSAVFVFLFMRLGAGNITQLKLVSVFLGFAVGFSGAWGAYYTELFPQKFSALSSGISFNGGRIISTFAIPAIAGLGSAAAGMQGIFMVSMAVFVAGAVIWMFLPETYQKNEKAADNTEHTGGCKMGQYQEAKKVALSYFDALEKAEPEQVLQVFREYMTEDYNWKGVYPFREQNGREAVAESFWIPLKKALRHMQRRQDIFIAGTNEISGEEWVMSMGHLMGLFDQDFLGIRHTRKMASLRYAEFSCVENGKICKSGMFVDLIGLMIQAGENPLPPSTGNYFIYPGPRYHDGILLEDAPEEEGIKTLALVNKMVDDLDELNKSGAMGCPPEVLEKAWASDMIWYGPGGIGASYTIPRYQEQHQLPFRNHLKDKTFNGHVCRFAEGNFACFFGWPNLTNTPIGGFLGLPGGGRGDMQVVDVYCRRGDKLSENWVLIDLPYWLKQQGLDIFERTRQILNHD